MKRSIAEDLTRTHQLSKTEQHAIKKVILIAEDLLSFYRETPEAEALTAMIGQLEGMYDSEPLVDETPPTDTDSDEEKPLRGVKDDCKPTDSDPGDLLLSLLSRVPGASFYEADGIQGEAAKAEQSGQLTKKDLRTVHDACQKRREDIADREAAEAARGDKHDGNSA